MGEAQEVANWSGRSSGSWARILPEETEFLRIVPSWHVLIFQDQIV